MAVGPRGPDGPGGHQNRIVAKTGSPGRGAAVCATRATGVLPSLAGRERER